MHDIIFSDATLKSLDIIRAKYGLHLDVLAGLEDETNLHIAGKTTVEEFVEGVELIVGKTADPSAVLKDIDSAIFAPLRESLKNPAPEPVTPSTVVPVQKPAAVAENKLATPTVQAPTAVPAAPLAQPSTPPQQSSGEKRYVANVDPYREAIE